MGLLRYQTGFDCMPLWYLQQARKFSWGKAGTSRLSEWKVVIWFLPSSDLPCDIKCDIVKLSWECGDCTSFHFSFWEILDKRLCYIFCAWLLWLHHAHLWRKKCPWLAREVPTEYLLITAVGLLHILCTSIPKSLVPFAQVAWNRNITSLAGAQ